MHCNRNHSHKLLLCDSRNPSYYTHILNPRDFAVKNNMIAFLAGFEDDKALEPIPFHRS
jgi:hypothetical protein